MAFILKVFPFIVVETNPSREEERGRRTID
jgi:hypothetical protein